MVQIINNEQLDFNDVLIVPQATTINHRGEVDIVRKFKNIDLNCCPIMNANMTQTGTFKVAEKMVKNKMIGAFHKFYTAEEIIKFFTDNESDAQERKITLEYWNNETFEYLTSDFYRPDINFTIKKITENDIIYNEFEISLVEY